MASYMDMVTVLMCLFIVLYAMSTVDAQKWESLKLALATGFGAEQSENADTAEGIVVPEELIGSTGPEEGYAGLEDEPSELEELEQLQQQLEAALGATGLSDRAQFSIDERGLTVKLIGGETFFDGNSAHLRPDAIRVLDALGPVLAASGRHLSIEGNADPRFNPAPFETTWELAAARATGVLRYLVERSGVSPDLVAGTTYGSEHPVSDQVQLNRRVDVVVLANDPEGLAEELAEREAEQAQQPPTGDVEPAGDDESEEVPPSGH